jgi:hypothetical protein
MCRPTDDQWAGLIGHLAACDRRYRRAVGRLRRTGEGAADVLAALEDLAAAARACATATDAELTRRHFARQVERYELQAESLRTRLPAECGAQ